VARAARNGALTASDPGGQVRAEVTGEGIVTAVADLPTTPITTPYERWADSFAWLCILSLLGGLGLLARSRDHCSQYLHQTPTNSPTTFGSPGDTRAAV
jgi:apolipoprotein N-acyltransferase